MNGDLSTLLSTLTPRQPHPGWNCGIPTLPINLIMATNIYNRNFVPLVNKYQSQIIFKTHAPVVILIIQLM